MSAFSELVGEIVFQGVIAQPVIFVRWLLSDRKKSYKQFCREADVYGASCLGVVTLVGVLLVYVWFAGCRNQPSEDLEGFWIVPGDPVVTIVIEKDSIAYPDAEPGVKHSYKKINNRLVVDSEEGPDTIVYKQNTRDTLWLRWPYAEAATMLVRNK